MMKVTQKGIVRVALQGASALILAMGLVSCGGSAPKQAEDAAPAQSEEVAQAGDTIGSACPEAMELMKKFADAVEQADKSKNYSDQAYLDELDATVKRLDEIAAGIKAPEEADVLDKLAAGVSKVREEQAENKPISVETGALFTEASKNFNAACMESLKQQ